MSFSGDENEGYQKMEEKPNRQLQWDESNHRRENSMIIGFAIFLLGLPLCILVIVYMIVPPSDNLFYGVLCYIATLFGWFVFVSFFHVNYIEFGQKIIDLYKRRMQTKAGQLQLLIINGTVLLAVGLFFLLKQQGMFEPIRYDCWERGKVKCYPQEMDCWPANSVNCFAKPKE